MALPKASPASSFLTPPRWVLTRARHLRRFHLAVIPDVPTGARFRADRLMRFLLSRMVDSVTSTTRRKSQVSPSISTFNGALVVAVSCDCCALWHSVELACTSSIKRPSDVSPGRKTLQSCPFSSIPGSYMTGGFGLGGYAHCVAPSSQVSSGPSESELADSTFA